MKSTASTTKSCSPLTLILTLAIAAATIAQAETNLLKNPGFESSSESGSPSYWITYPGARESQTEPRIEVLKRQDAAEKKCYLRMSKRGGNSNLELVQGINITDPAGQILLDSLDKNLVFKGKIRGEELTDKMGGLAIQVFSKASDGTTHFAGRVYSKDFAPSAAWMTAEVSLRLSDIIPSGETLAYLDIILLLGSNTGQIDFDDLSLTTEL